MDWTTNLAQLAGDAADCDVKLDDRAIDGPGDCSARKQPRGAAGQSKQQESPTHRARAFQGRFSCAVDNLSVVFDRGANGGQNLVGQKVVVQVGELRLNASH